MQLCEDYSVNDVEMNLQSVAFSAVVFYGAAHCRVFSAFPALPQGGKASLVQWTISI